ncbi:hypothetical protein OYC64_020602 [Pagothenia borchgrevinki]|uniref:Uncharacterized protein n=1 Tax=Pagothenia borchgrevinki TaxID=8213 RepID=A0ABD2FMF6_PAGBO
MGSEQEEWFQDEVLEYQPVVDLEQDWDQVALDQEPDMDLVDMGLELDKCLGQGMDQVEAMVQDQELDMDKAMELDQKPLNTV